ncbi:MAG: hypothetical protein FJ104_17875, partial [Deltaproteobacteria bacterium]|nr:hypothetical protein [Deltaproteobacteria bacterium]
MTLRPLSHLALTAALVTACGAPPTPAPVPARPAAVAPARTAAVDPNAFRRVVPEPGERARISFPEVKRDASPGAPT